MIEGISKQKWDQIQPKENPFLNYEFFVALKESHSIGKETGWIPELLINHDQDAALFFYEKNHSYGEYIFDWQWAEAFNKYNVPYYPKLTSMLPFTPVTTSHFLMQTFNEKKAVELLIQFEAKYNH